jgi:hypothetical protein
MIGEIEFVHGGIVALPNTPHNPPSIPLPLSMSLYPNSICWLRRDLRLSDHAALYHALKQSQAVHCVFVFDTDILNQLANRADRRVEFIWHSLADLRSALRELGSDLHILHGSAQQLIPRFALQIGAQAVFCNHDEEPQAHQRDAIVATQLGDAGIAFHDYKDHVIFERNEIRTGSGTPYRVFTPYKNTWLQKVDDFYLRAYPTEKYFSHLAKFDADELPKLTSASLRCLAVCPVRRRCLKTSGSAWLTTMNRAISLPSKVCPTSPRICVSARSRYGHWCDSLIFPQDKVRKLGCRN